MFEQLGARIYLARLYNNRGLVAGNGRGCAPANSSKESIAGAPSRIATRRPTTLDSLAGLHLRTGDTAAALAAWQAALDELAQLPEIPGHLHSVIRDRMVATLAFPGAKPFYQRTQVEKLADGFPAPGNHLLASYKAVAVTAQPPPPPPAPMPGPPSASCIPAPGAWPAVKRSTCAGAVRSSHPLNTTANVAKQDGARPAEEDETARISTYLLGMRPVGVGIPAGVTRRTRVPNERTVCLLKVQSGLLKALLPDMMRRAPIFHGSRQLFRWNCHDAPGAKRHNVRQIDGQLDRSKPIM